MKYIITWIVLLNCAGVLGQTPANDPHWKLVWEDHFNTLNSNIWKVENHFDHYGGEHQVYIDDNVYLENGSLVLEIKKEEYSCPESVTHKWGCARQAKTGRPYQYTSGWVETKLPYHSQYGYMEARLKIPYGNGFWPAFWTFNQDYSYQEIDIFEMVPGRRENCHLASSPNFIHGAYDMSSNVHIKPPGSDPMCAGKFRVNQVADYTKWHTYGLEWSPSKLIIYVDDYPVRLIPNPGINAKTKMILNVALNPDRNILPYHDADFPDKMYIDYVKVYELDEECHRDVTLCNYDFTYHDNKVKNKIIIGNGSCSNSLSVGDNVYLRAGEGIYINGDFNVPIGAQMYLDANPCKK